MARAVGYIRVSTKEQDENVQRVAIERFAKDNGIELLTFFVDKGESRMKKWESRPGARKLIEFIRSKKVSTLNPERN